MKKYDFRKIEKTWQDVWAKTGIYRAQDFSKKPKFYPLVEFPYPSGAGLHVGHVRSYTAMDVLARKRRMEGQNVLYPIGWDAFGLPTENYAVKTGIHPAKVTRQNSDTFRRQLKRMGFSFDWSREVNTTDPEYYKWTQWIFLQLYKHGLAYKAKSTINWCPSCKIGLANEEVVASKCERCGAAVEEREKEQWMLRITKYADKLLKGLETVNFLPRIRSQQENWIGRSEGAEIQFPISNYQFPIPVFTTRPDTLFGATYMVLSPEHPLIEKLKDRIKNLGEVKRYIQRAKGKTEAERIENREKTGVELRGIKAINPANGKKTPIFVADYVLSGYGTGAIMAVPAHDERDYEFARKFKLPIRQVIAPYFSNTEGKDAIRSDKKTVHRHTAYVLLRHSTRDKYLCLDWEKFGWHSGIIGGIDPGEDPVQAAKREILEETGYRHVRFVRYVGGEQHNHFFATHKDENRYAFGTGMLFELTDEKKAPVELEHTKNHQPVWIEAGRMESWLNLASFQYIWQVLKSNQECFTGNGVAINSGKFNGLNSEEAKWQITTAVGGKKTAKYHLRDWIFSRQRYWGEPIPMIYCEQCAKKPKVLILHGLGGNSRENWLPWAKRELETRGYEVFVPDLPRTNSPRMVEQIESLKKLDITKEDRLTIVAHSLGAPLACEFVRVRKLSVEKLVLVAPTGRAQGELQWRNLRKAGVTAAGIRAIQEFNAANAYVKDIVRSVRETIILLSDNDPYIPLSVRKDYVALKPRVKIMKKRGHFNRAAHVTELPELLESFPHSTFHIPHSNPGWLPVPESDLPVKLPSLKDFKPRADGESPLSKAENWVKTKCPECGGEARRETDVMPNWAGSSWYYLAYPAIHRWKLGIRNWKLLFKYWLPVDWYNGGMEHTTLHLLYSRFWNQFLHDIGVVPVAEPYAKRTSQGMVLGEGGIKMSKSKGNVINPDDVIRAYGADVLRLYEMFMGPFDQAIPWDPKSIEGVNRFLSRVWNVQMSGKISPETKDIALERLGHKTVKKVGQDIESMAYNTAVSTMMIFVNACQEAEAVPQNIWEQFLLVLAPFAPHITEELWQQLRIKNKELRIKNEAGDRNNSTFHIPHSTFQSVHSQAWPQYDPALIRDDLFTLVIQVNGKLRDTVEVPMDINEADAKKLALSREKIIVYLGITQPQRVIYVPRRLVNIVA